MSNMNKISCLCVSKAEAPLLQRAIDCFEKQTHPEKELILVYQNQLPDVRLPNNCICVEAPSDLLLGELRNIAMSKASGNYLCQWDADDWYHPERLQTQLEFLNSHDLDVCLLAKWLIFNAKTCDLYIGPKRIDGWEGSILYKADKKIPYDPTLSKGEDRSMTKRLLQRTKWKLLYDPWLYVYVYHGNNTWSEDHFQTIFSQSQPLQDPGLLETLKSSLTSTDTLPPLGPSA